MARDHKVYYQKRKADARRRGTTIHEERQAGHPAMRQQLKEAREEIERLEKELSRARHTG